MKFTLKHATAAILLILSFAAPVAAGQFEDGVAAAKRGDDATALSLWRPLAEQGNAVAQYNLGVMFAKGRGVPQDFQEALKWYRLAAAQGSAQAQNNLGVAYTNAQGVAQDYQEALKWCRLAATQGYAQAQKNLGVMYEDGLGVAQDSQEAAKWYQLAHAQELKQQAADGSIISSGNWTATSNDAFFNVGIMFSNGEGLSKDYVQAYKWFTLSAARGNDEAVIAIDKIASLMTPAQIAEARNLALSASSTFCLFGICTTPEQRAKGNADEAQRLLKLGEERKRTKAVCAQFTDRLERNACDAYGPDLGPDAELKQRRRSQSPYGSDPERCKYRERVYFDCAHRNGASQCKVEDDARLACASQ
jgi:TPR repeat protein